jgi:hypothetical protein
MTPWLIGFVCLAVIVLLGIGLWACSVAAVEAYCAQWEEDQVRRIAADGEGRCFFPDCGAQIKGDCLGCQRGNADLPDNWHCPACGRARGAGCGRDDMKPPVGCYLLGGPLPDNWQELDGKGSFDEAWDAMRRKTGGT